MNLSENECVNEIRQCTRTLRQIQLDLYSINASSINAEKINTLSQKIDMEILKYDNTIYKITSKVMNIGSLRTLKDYIFYSFKKITHEVHRLISMSTQNYQNHMGIINSRFNKIHQFQHQMECQWNEVTAGNISTKEKKVVKFKVPDRKEIKSFAKETLHKQFLAIRLMAYKMYQKYSYHNHDQILQEMQLLKEQQSKINKQLEQTKLLEAQLKISQKQLQKQLNQLKNINSIIGNRYFVPTNIIENS